MEDLTDQQLEELKQKADSAEKFKGESEAKAKEYETAKVEWEKKEKEYQESVNPNWQKARKTIDTLKEVAKSKGVEVDEDGNIKNAPQNVDIEKVREEARNTARQELLGGRLNEILDEYDDASKPVVKKFYDKLVFGENVNLQNIRGYVQQAENAAKTQANVKKTDAFVQFSGGRGPRQPEEGKIDDATAKEVGSRMGLRFASADDKK